MIKSELIDRMAPIPIINTHCHHLPATEQIHQSLDSILCSSYNSWCMLSWGETSDAREEFCRQMQGNTYFYWFEKSLQMLCNIPEPLNGSTWPLYDAAVQALSSSPSFHLDVLQNKCRYQYVLWDPYWNTNTENEYPGFYTPVYRIDMFFFGYCFEAHDHDGNHPQKICQWTQWPKTLGEYLDKIEGEIAAAKNRGCVALKNATAYDRTLCYQAVSLQEAEKAWGNSNASLQEVRAFQDYVFHHICYLAEKYQLPIQIHTGLGALDGSNALQLRSVIKRFPHVKFVLFHGSYPWMGDVLALAQCFPNICLDLCWLPIISTSACKRFLREYIETCSMDRITWGCDTWNSFESFGAVLAAKEVLSSVLADCVTEGLLPIQSAEQYAQHILHTNANTIYRLET